jgi:hypothetical protein
MGLRVDTREVDKMFEDLIDMDKDVMTEALPKFKENTPIATGNARKRTKLTQRKKNYTIHANYPYAGRLDEGWSKQRPKGMTAPTERDIDDLVERYIKRVT